jgi:guanine deaminase
MSLTLRGKVLTPITPDEVRYLPDGVVHVDDAGRIAAVVPADAWSGRVDQDHRPGVLMPGFVDAHVHWAQTRIVGAATGPLLDWLARSTFPEEGRFADEAHARAVARMFLANLAAAGTTTCLAYGPVFPRATEVLLEEALRSGQRLVTGPVLMDDDCPPELRLPADVALPALEALADRWHGKDDRLFLAAIPRFALSCTRGMMTGAGALARARGLHVSTHLAENVDEIRVAEARFGQDYLAIYEDAGLVHPNASFAHCVHLSASAWDRFAAADAVVAHCPDSNYFLGSGGMPIAEVEARGVRVALGTDVAGGRSFRVPRTISAGFDNALARGAPVGLRRWLWWATRGGALALGRSEVGLLVPGLDADVVCLDVPPWADGVDEVLGWALLDGDAPRARATWTRGRQVWHRAASTGYPWQSE